MPGEKLWERNVNKLLNNLVEHKQLNRDLNSADVIPGGRKISKSPKESPSNSPKVRKNTDTSTSSDSESE